MPRFLAPYPALCLAVALATPWPATAATEAGCPQTRHPLPIHVVPKPPRKLTFTDPSLRIHARRFYAIEGGVSEFSGAVELARNDDRITAETLRYDKASDEVDAEGNVTFISGIGAIFQTPKMHMQLGSNIGYAAPIIFSLPGQYARGDAERIDFLGPDHSRLMQSRYTTCPLGRDDWYLKVRQLDIDTKKDIGTARHATVDFQGVPIFYFPYLSFPISDQRKSGFLVPRIGTSNKLGVELATPYYWNIAPNYDATITPAILSSRGLQLQNEFRYLTTHSSGQLEAEFLPHDKKDNNNDRSAAAYLHKQSFNPLWSANVDIRGVSDTQYFNDFGDNLGITSQTRLPQTVTLDYFGPLWRFTARAADYQTIDPTIAPLDKPYARLPQLVLGANLPVTPNRLNYHFDSELTHFERKASVTGERLNLSPAISLPLSNRYSFITPRLAVQQVSYHLTDAPKSTPMLSRGVASLDSGLLFERSMRWGQQDFTQTLEPRLYYLYVPYRNQDNLPVFDTALADLSFPGLFRDNRFSGGDRVGDANQATWALTTRFFDNQDGNERLRASLGRIYHYNDLKVHLPSTINALNPADIVGEMAATLVGNWHLRSNIAWDQQQSLVQKYNYYFQYNPDKYRIINIGRRYARNELSQLDMSTEWPLFGHWTLRARSLYSLREGHNLDSYAGVEYNACCWQLRVLASSRLVTDNLSTQPSTTSQSYAILIELELTGLSKLGRAPISPLQESLFSFPQKLR